MSPRASALLRKLWWLGLLALLTLTQLCFWQDSNDPFAPVELALAKTLVPLCLLPWLWQAGLDWRALLARWPARLLLAWMAWLWVAALEGPSQANGLKTALEYNLYACLFFLPAALDRERRRQAMAAFMGASLLAAAYGLLQHFNADPWRWSTNFDGRPLGTIGNPDFFAGHLVLAWSLALGWLLSSRPGRRALPGAVLALLTWAQVYSRVAGAWLGMGCAGAAAAGLLLTPPGSWLRRNWGLRRRSVALALVSLTLAAGAAVSIGPGREAWQRFRQEKAVSVVNRRMMWRVAVGLWERHPVQGAGLDSYRPLYPRLQAEILAAEPQAGWNYVVTWLPHQNYLYLLCETGLIGALLFMGAWAVAALEAWRRLRRGDALALSLFLALTGLAGVAMLNTFSNITATALAFFLLLGMAAWPARDSPASESPVSLETAVASLVLALLLAVPAGKELAANRYTREAGRADKRGDFATEAQLDRRAADLGVARLSPQSLVGVHFSLGEALRQSAQQQPDPRAAQAQMQGAVEAYQADLAEGPWAPETHNMLGAALGQLGSMNHDAALLGQSAQHLETAAWLSPGYSSALMNLGGTRMLLGDVSGAAQAWQQTLVADPDNALAKGYLAALKGRR